MSARKNLAFLLGGSGAAFVIQFASSLVIARLLSPSELGIYAASMAVVWIINGLLNVALEAYIVRERELSDEKVGTVYALALAQGALIGGGLLLFAPLLGGFARDERVTESLYILALYGALMPCLTMLYGVMQRRLKFQRMAALNVLNVGAAAVATVTLAALGMSWRSMPIGTGIGVTITLLVASFLQRRELNVRLNVLHWREVVVFGSRMMLASLFLNLTNRVPDIVLTRIAGASATGLYNRGANPIDTFNNTLLGNMERVLMTQLARDRDAGMGMGPAYLRITAAATAIIWPAFALVAVLAAPIINILFGAKWLAAAPVLVLIAIGASINLGVANRMGVLVTAGRERDLPRLEAIRGVIGVTLFATAAYAGGLVWAAGTRITDAIIACALYSPGIHAATGLRWNALLRVFARSALLAMLTAVPALLAMTLLGWPQTLHFFALAAIGVLSGAVWLGTMFVIRHELTFDIARALLMVRARFR